MQSNEVSLQDNNESFGLRLVLDITLTIEYVTITELYLSAGSVGWLLWSDTKWGGSHDGELKYLGKRNFKFPFSKSN